MGLLLLIVFIYFSFRFLKHKSRSYLKKSLRGGYGVGLLNKKGKKRNRINTILSDSENIGANLAFSRLRKSYFELKNHRTRDINKLISDHIKTNLNVMLLDGHGVTFDSIKLVKADSTPMKPITIEAINKTHSELLEDSKTNIRKIFMAKDIAFLSDGNYSLFRTLSQLDSCMPTIHSI